MALHALIKNEFQKFSKIKRQCLMFGNFEKGSALTYWVATFLVEFE